MTPADLSAWLDRRGLSQRQAAPLLGVTQQAVNLWATGKRPIPGTVVRLIECLDRADTLERAATGAAAREEE